MKVYYAADLDSRSFEGRTKIATALKKYLEAEGVVFVDDPKCADLIHAHSSGVAASFSLLKLKKKYDKPIIYSLYSVCETEPLGHFTNHLQQRYYLGKRQTSFLLSYSAVVPLRWRGMALKKLEAVVVPNDYVKRKIFSNTRVIPIGIDVNYFIPVPNFYKKNKNSSRLRVAYFGHPSVYKGLVDFAKASCFFPDSVEALVFVSRSSEKIRRSLLRLNPRLKVEGFKNDLVQAYNSVDVVVAPHRSKLGSIANPLVILEAMACGKAVVTTDFEFIKNVVGDAAVVVPARSPKAIAAAVERLRDKNLREVLGQKARERVCLFFNQERMFKMYFDLYKEFVSNIEKNERK